MDEEEMFRDILGGRVGVDGGRRGEGGGGRREGGGKRKLEPL